MILKTTMPVERDGREVLVTIEGYYRRAERDTDTYEAVVFESSSIPLERDEHLLAEDALWDRLDSIRGEREEAEERWRRQMLENMR